MIKKVIVEFILIMMQKIVWFFIFEKNLKEAAASTL
jgi:hypothetical protein